jgi:hypothetical protein
MLTLAAGFAAHADFSYTQTTKPSQGAPQVAKTYLKGSKMAVERDGTATIMDFGAQTITTVDKTGKTYSVRKMGDMIPPGGPSVTPQMDVKETGQKRTINGMNCTQMVMTMSMDAPAGGPPGMKMQMEMEMWISTDVPGWQNMRAFYQKNGNALGAMAGGNPGLQKAMVEMQKKMATMNGMPVEQIMRMKAPGMDAAQAPGAQAGMGQARARLEEMIKQGGPQADAARQALARMPGGGGGGGSLFETTMTSSDFSSSDVPDSVFAIPAGFTQK